MPHDGAVLVTGGLGCIGAWTTRELLLRGHDVVVLDASDDRSRLDRLMPRELHGQARVVRGDISDLHGLEQVLARHSVSRIVHLAAFQLPSCRADPPAGALVNVLGTVNLFDAASRLGVTRIVYTSSVAVFDQSGGRLPVDAAARPASHYGVFKLANEGTARVYWEDRGLPSLGLRPMTVYGPGRDRGLTSSPTRAMLAAILGCRYEIAFGGTTLFHYALDVSRALVAAVLDAQFDGARVHNLNGERASVSEFVACLSRLVGPAAGGITAGRIPLPFPNDLDTTGLDVLGPPPVTPIEEGIAATLEFFSDLQTRGVLVPEHHGLEVRDGLAIDHRP